MASRQLTSVTGAVQRELRLLAQLDDDLANSATALLALAMARELDNRANSATSKSMCARVLLDTMAKLRELAPVSDEMDAVDELTARRAARVAGITNP